jgi:GT2 family glycosyltransferase
MRNRPSDCHVIVVDQSTDDRTKHVFEEVSAGCGLEMIYHRSSGTGLSLARNEAAQLAGNGLLLFTDDDCEVDDTWVPAWVRLLGNHPECGMGFGRVAVPDFNSLTGHIPSFDPGPAVTSTHGHELFASGADRVGMGANMVLRHSTWLDVGGFDELTGPGARFQAADDLDMALRVAARGMSILHSSDAVVLHHGFRTTAEASRLGFGYALGTGAMYVKHLRCRGEGAWPMLLRVASGHVARVVRAAVTGERPTGFTSLRGLVTGMLAAARLDLDASRRTFRPHVHGVGGTPAVSGA